MKIKPEIGAGHRSGKRPAHWTTCQYAGKVSLRMASDFRRGGPGVSEGNLPQPGVKRAERAASCGLFYELTVEEPSKSHLTTRMVTSSLKLSPQKSAAAL
jgi:hypothetical protein